MNGQFHKLKGEFKKSHVSNSKYNEYKNLTLLTSKLHFRLPADDGPKSVGGNALIHSSMVDDMGVIDQQVPLHKAVVRI